MNVEIGRASQTAEVVALFRALETARPPHERLFTDPLAKDFLRPWGRAMIGLARVPAAYRIISRSIDRRWPGARTSAVARTRLIDDAVCAAVGGGASQVLLLGAGFDTRAHRLAELEHVRVFEVDRAPTQQKKVRLITRTLGRPPTHVRYVPVDFQRDDLASALRTKGFDPAARTFVIWEGVTNYLAAPRVASAFDDIVESVGPRSEVLFTYVHAGLLDGSVHFEGGAEILKKVSAAREPWTFGFDPRELPAYLAARGMTLIDDVSADEYRERCFGSASKLMRGYSFYRVAQAIVVSKGRGV